MAICTAIFVVAFIAGNIGFWVWLGLRARGDHQKQSMPPEATAGFRQDMVSLETRSTFSGSAPSTG